MDTEKGDLGRPGREGEIWKGLGWRRTEQEISMGLERDEQIMGRGQEASGSPAQSGY